MQRDFSRLEHTGFDLLVVGGGITGACVARDAALRGLRVALVDKSDFASETTAASSKLIHGGLRYLQNLELGFVRQSLRERRIWSQIAPHMVDPLAFLIPATSTGLKKRTVLHMALSAYDLLAYDRNRLEDPAKHLPLHGNIDRETAIRLEPGLEQMRQDGAMIFYDCQMFCPERLALECIQDAATHDAAVFNYCELVQFTRHGESIAGAHVRDTETGREYDIRAKVVVNAAGPWADLLMGDLQLGHASRKLIRSKGIHLITRALTNGHGITVPSRGGHFFLLPWRGHTLIGTTDTVFEGEPGAFAVTEDDIAAFLAVVNAGYPAARLRRDEVLHFYGGMRPIVDVEGGCGAKGVAGASYGASRAPEVYDHEKRHGLGGVITAIGGKWTTSRALAADVVDLACRKLGRTPPPASTGDTPTHGGHTGRFGEFVARAVREHPAFAPETIANLTKYYGSRYGEVLRIAEEDPRLAKPLGARFPDIAAQVVYGIRHEMARHLDDILFRRTGLGTLGHPGDDTIEAALDCMAALLQWDAQQRDAERARALRHFTPQPAPAHAAA